MNVRREAKKLLEGNIGTKLPESWNDFLVLTSKQKQQKKKKFKTEMGLHQTKKLLRSERDYQQNGKSNLMNGRKYLQIMYLIRV